MDVNRTNEGIHYHGGTDGILVLKEMTKMVTGCLSLALALLANMKPIFSNALSFTEVTVHWFHCCSVPIIKSGNLVATLLFECSRLLGVLYERSVQAIHVQDYSTAQVSLFLCSR